MKVKLRKCKFCEVPFKPTYSTVQATCSPRCAIEYSKTVQKAKDNREWQREKKERKKALLSHSEWLNLFQKVFNTYIRARDKNSFCISCETPLNGRKFDAGHYRSVGSNPQLRFNEENVWGQCVPCNRDKHGNLIEYRKGLIKKIGVEKVEYLENFNNSAKLSIPEIQEKIKEYKAKTKELI